MRSWWNLRVWWLSGLLAAVAGCALLARWELDNLHQSFDTDARIAHRLLSQRVVQHDAILATVVLLQAPAGQDSGPEQRLPALYPQVLKVLRRGSGDSWNDASLARAEERSRQLGRAVLADLDSTAGKYRLVLAGFPASYAMVIDLARTVPTEEWPMSGPDHPARVTLALEDNEWLLQPGQSPARGWNFTFAKTLAAESQPFEVRIQRRAGWSELPWASMTAWSLAVWGAVAFLVAWTRQRQARRRAEELLRLGQVARLNALGELAAGLAHELNQPLTAVLASTQAAQRLLAEDPPDETTARDAMTQAAAQARRAADVLTRLRRLVERPSDRQAKEGVDLSEAAQRVLFLLDPECRKRSVTVSLRGADKPVKVLADPVALDQIIHNLLMNALQALEQASGEQRQIILTIGADGTNGELRVQDNGPGIPENLRHRVFEPFFSTKDGGLGLGLSLCENLASRMDGSLTLHPGVTRGASFVLQLPLQKPGDTA